MLQVQSPIAQRLAVALAVASAATGSATAPAHADEPKSGVVIDINSPKRTLYPLALPMSPEGDAQASREIATVSSFDLSVAGFFKVLDPAGFLSDLKAEGLGVDPQKWKDAGAYGVVKYRVTAGDVEFRLYEVAKGASASLTKTYSRKDGLRQIAHRWCNEVVKYYTGEPGFFGSKIAFAVKAKTGNAIYAMDFDGANAYAVSRNSSTNMFPAWSPDGSQLAYTSYMRNNPDLYIGSASGGRPRQVSKFRGMNTGASWSPDGSQIALTLSKDGSPDIYIISAATGAVIRRLTNDKAIDTSPAWSPDGSQIAFVSDRNGGPQIFVVPAAG
ncbi:MAG TPA: hypothetical protein VN253_20065, partial [Kofleriaceae bacterium]|nr:hypothetical protein [Kofleriaceae bacterium]